MYVLITHYPPSPPSPPPPFLLPFSPGLHVSGMECFLFIVEDVQVSVEIPRVKFMAAVCTVKNLARFCLNAYKQNSWAVGSYRCDDH